MVTPKEALADAIMSFEGWKPGSRSNRNRNPGNLRPYDPLQPTDGQNYRVFQSLIDGYQALLDDLTVKLTKDFGPTNTLLDVLNKYAPAGDANNPSVYTQYVAKWMSSALGLTIEPSTPLSNIF